MVVLGRGPGGGVRFLMSEVPLRDPLAYWRGRYSLMSEALEDSRELGWDANVTASGRAPVSGLGVWGLQGYLAHRKTPTPLGPP